MTCWTWCCPVPRKLVITDMAAFTGGEAPESAAGDEDWEDSSFAEFGILEREVETHAGR